MRRREGSGSESAEGERTGCCASRQPPLVCSASSARLISGLGRGEDRGGAATADGAELGALAATYVLITTAIGPLAAECSERIVTQLDHSSQDPGPLGLQDRQWS